MAKTVYYSKKYNERMKIEAPTGDVVLTKAPTRRLGKMVPLLMLLCLLLAVMCVLLVPMLVGGATAAQGRVVSQAQVVQYNSQQEALASLGISPALPAALPEGYSFTACRVVDGAVYEAEFTSGRQVVVLRVAAGNQDLSGVDYDTVAYTATEAENGVTRGYAGVSEKKLTSAVWVDGDCSYAIVAQDGISAALMREFARSVG